jgi:hypothetical protein
VRRGRGRRWGGNNGEPEHGEAWAAVGRGRRWGGVSGLPERGAGGGRGGGEAQGEAKGEGKEKEEESRPRGRYSHFLCRVPAIRHSAKFFLKFKNKLCRVLDVQHSAKFCSAYFAECQRAGTRQRRLCRVLDVQHSAKYTLFFLFLATKLFVVCSYTI